ncbi:uncharacterized protein TNCV_4033821 [Trichonephila clavipes]|nr:uncharacterized protein TNCV_4033821 [Trichonephila clavipes]
MDLCQACHESTVEGPPCRGGGLTINMLRLKRLPVGVVLGEGSAYSGQKKNSNGAKGMQLSSGHITDFIGIKGVMAAVGVYLEEGQDNRDAIEEMPRIQLNSRAVHAFCVGSRAVGYDLHTSHVSRSHSADSSGDNAVKIKLQEFLFPECGSSMASKGGRVVNGKLVKPLFRYPWIAVTPKCLGGPRVDRDRRNEKPGFKVSDYPKIVDFAKK